MTAAGTRRWHAPGPDGRAYCGAPVSLSDRIGQPDRLCPACLSAMSRALPPMADRRYQAYVEQQRLIRYLEVDGTLLERVWLPVIRLAHWATRRELARDPVRRQYL